MKTALLIILILIVIIIPSRKAMVRYKRLLFFGLSLFTNGESRLVRLFSRPIDCTLTEYDDEGQNYPIKIFQPPKVKHPLPAVILYHGATPFGLDHPTMNLLAENLVRLGVRVFHPLMPQLANMKLSPQTIPRMKRFYRQVEQRDDIQADKIMIAGVSFSGGMVVRLSTDPEINPASVISYGSYYDLATTLQFFFTGQARFGDTEIEMTPHEYTKAVWFWNYIDKLKLPFDTGPVTEAIEIFIRRDYEEAKRYQAECTPEQQEFLDHVFTPADPRSLPYLKEAAEKVQEDVESISPRYFIDDIQSPLFVIHGTQDDMIPYTENLAMTTALDEHNKNYYSHLIRLFGHTAANRASLWGLVKEVTHLIKLLVRLIKTIE